MHQSRPSADESKSEELSGDEGMDEEEEDGDDETAHATPHHHMNDQRHAEQSRVATSRHMFFVGQWLDVKDTVNQWLEATVVSLYHAMWSNSAQLFRSWIYRTRALLCLFTTMGGPLAGTSGFHSFLREWPPSALAPCTPSTHRLFPLLPFLE